MAESDIITDKESLKIALGGDEMSPYTPAKIAKMDHENLDISSNHD